MENAKSKLLDKPTQNEIKNVMNFLFCGPDTLKKKSGALDDNRVLYFKGRHAANALLRECAKKDKRSKNVPNFQTREEACSFLQECLREEIYFLPVNKTDKIKLSSVPCIPKKAKFSEDEYYMILHEGSKIKSLLQVVAIITIIFSFVVIQIWPERPRRLVYYASIASVFLLLLLAIVSIVRYLINVVCKLLFGIDLWIFPGLYEDVSLKENFFPVFEIYENPKKNNSGNELLKSPVSKNEASPNKTESPEN